MEMKTYKVTVLRSYALDWKTLCYYVIGESFAEASRKADDWFSRVYGCDSSSHIRKIELAGELVGEPKEAK